MIPSHETSTPIVVKPNHEELLEVILPHSEVCLHMRVAGKRAYVRLTTPKGRKQPVRVQIYDKDKRTFSAPVLPGEGGFYCDHNLGHYYYRPNTAYQTTWVGETCTGYAFSVQFKDETKFLGKGGEMTVVVKDAQLHNALADCLFAGIKYIKEGGLPDEVDGVHFTKVHTE